MTTNKRAQRPKGKQAKSSQPVPTPQASDPALVRVHDLSGFACLGLTAELRSIFDEETYKAIVSALESLDVTLMIRHPDDIVYVHLKLMTQDLSNETGIKESQWSPATESRPTVLKPLEATQAPKASKPTRSPTRLPRGKA